MTIILTVLISGWLDLGRAAEFSSLHLREGEQRLLHFPGLRRYSASGQAIRVARVPKEIAAHGTEESLLVKGQQPGIGEVWVWTEDGRSHHRSIEVAKAAHSRPADLELALSRLEEVAVVGAPGGKTVLQGEIRSRAECSRIRALKQVFGALIIDESVPTPALAEQGFTDLDRWLTRSAWGSRLRIERVGFALQLRGTIGRSHDRDQVERQAAGIYGCVQSLLLAAPDESPTLAFRVYLLEMRKDRLGSMGLGWPASQPAAFRVSPWGIQRNIALDVAIQMLEGEGAARVLSSPELVVRAPGEAELFAGGEIPIRATSQYSSQVSWRPYGLTFKLVVGAASEERVRVDILTEVSHLSESIGGESLPGVQSNRMKTQVDAKYGEPLLLSGLLRRETREQARGLPGLRSIPVLGSLFGSKDYLEARSELVAILVPQLRAPSVAKPETERPLVDSPWRTIQRELSEPERPNGGPNDNPAPRTQPSQPSQSPRVPRWFPT